MVAPLDTLDSVQMRPPCVSIERMIGSPIPIPLDLLVKKMSNSHPHILRRRQRGPLPDPYSPLVGIIHPSDQC
jgi:hypothetical protein